jgi:hypothetical protein
MTRCPLPSTLRLVRVDGKDFGLNIALQERPPIDKDVSFGNSVPISGAMYLTRSGEDLIVGGELVAAAKLRVGDNDAANF